MNRIVAFVARPVAFAFVLVAALTVPVPVVAQVVTVTWDGGGGDGRWSTAANWDGDALPGPTSNVIVRGAGSVHVDIDVTVNSLRFGDTDRSTASFGDDTLLVDAGRTLTIHTTAAGVNNFAEDVVIGGRLVLDLTDPIHPFLSVGPGNFLNNGEIQINGGPLFQDGGPWASSSSYYGSTFINQGVIAIDQPAGSLQLGEGITLNLGEIVLSHDAHVNFRGESTTVFGDDVSAKNGFSNGPLGVIRGTGSMGLGTSNLTESPRYQVPFVNDGTIALSTIADDPNGNDFSIVTYTTIQNNGSIAPSGVAGTVARIWVRCYGDIVPYGIVTVPVQMACHTWVGGGLTENWSDPLNWNLQEVPANATSLPILLKPAPVQPQLDVNFVANGKITIQANTTLTVLSGRSLTLSADVDNFGVLASLGTVTTSADFLNEGQITTAGQFVNTGTLTNEGSIQNDGGLRNDGTLINNGTLTTSDTFLNTNTIDNGHDGTLTNAGIFLNEGTLTNSGTVTTSSVLHNSGTIENRSGSTFTNAGHLANLSTGSFIVNCNVEFVAGSTSGTLTLFCAIWDGGGGDGRWSTAANWEGDTLPIATSSVIIRDAGIVHVDIDVTVNSLRFGDTDRSTASFGDDTLLVDVGRTLTIHTTAAGVNNFAEDVVIGGRLVLDLTDPIHPFLSVGPGNFLNNGEIQINGGPLFQDGGPWASSSSYYGSTFINQGVIAIDQPAGSLQLGEGITLNLGEIVLSHDAHVNFRGESTTVFGDDVSAKNGFTNGPPGVIRGTGWMRLGASQPTESPRYQVPFVNRGTIALSTTGANAEFSIYNYTTLQNHGSIGPGSSGVAGIDNRDEVRNACGATITVPISGNPIVQESCNTPPSVSAGSNQTIEATAPLTPVVLTGAAADADGDQLTVQWRDSSGALLGSMLTVNLQLALGTHVFTFHADDGNGGATSDSVQVIVRDTVRPDISAVRSPAANANGWNNTNVLVDFTCSDPVSGISVAPVDVTVAVQGANRSATASCRDGAGNLATFTMTGINIDKMAPTVTASRLPAANANGWNNTSVTIDFLCTDALSGVLEAPLDQVLQAEGSDQSASASCRDAADNVATMTESSINIDRTLPVVVGTPNRAPDSSGWYRNPFEVAWSGTDGLSGIAGCSAPSVYAGPDTAGHTLSGSCEDRAGNSGAAQHAFRFDATPPAIAIAAPAQGGAYLLNQPATAVYACPDQLSGVATCVGSVASGSTFDTSIPGLRTFTVQATDMAGNTATRTHSYAVQYLFGGFLAPLNNLPTMNRGPAGRTFAVRWQLRDANGTFIADPASITGLALVPGVCSSEGTDVSDVEATADGDDLKYDPTTGTWIFTLRTQRSQTGCWFLQLRLADGSVKPIGFELR